jgi:hypothetical protein
MFGGAAGGGKNLASPPAATNLSISTSPSPSPSPSPSAAPLNNTNSIDKAPVPDKGAEKTQNNTIKVPPPVAVNNSLVSDKSQPISGSLSPLNSSPVLNSSRSNSIAPPPIPQQLLTNKSSPATPLNEAEHQNTPNKNPEKLVKARTA